MKATAISLAISLGLIQPALAAPGTVECGSGRGESNNRSLLFATIAPTSEGFDLLLVEDRGKHVLTLDNRLVVQAAGTIEGQRILPWNLVAYTKQPVQIQPGGTFTLAMMVSTRSFCRFQGPISFMGGAQAKLFPAH